MACYRKGTPVQDENRSNTNTPYCLFLSQRSVDVGTQRRTV